MRVYCGESRRERRGQGRKESETDSSVAMWRAEQSEGRRRDKPLILFTARCCSLPHRVPWCCVSMLGRTRRRRRAGKESGRDDSEPCWIVVRKAGRRGGFELKPVVAGPEGRGGGGARKQPAVQRPKELRVVLISWPCSWGGARCGCSGGHRRTRWSRRRAAC
jgi:hypothetical protein